MPWTRCHRLDRLPCAPLLAPLLACILLGGCAGARVAMPSNTALPVPLVQKIPMPVGLYLDEELRTYMHSESIEGHGDWEIDIGPVQSRLFNNLLTGVFIGHREVDNPEQPPAGIAGVLIPAIDAMQFSIPEQTRTEYYEVWVQYSIELRDSQGAPAGEWRLAAYGRAHTQDHGSSGGALHHAALVACRDAMAYFAVQFPAAPVVQAWQAAALADSA